MGIVWTLRARGLAPSLGAGGSLVVASLCCLLFATALVTFRDWPGRGESSPDGTITMTPPAAKAAGRTLSGPASPVAVSAAPAPSTSTSRRPARRAAGRSAPRRAGAAPQAPAGTNPPAASAPVAAPAPGAPAPAASQPAVSAPQAPAPVAVPTIPQPKPGAGPVETVVETGREIIKPLPPVVQQPIQPVLDTVQQVGRTVDETAGPLLPTLP